MTAPTSSRAGQACRSERKPANAWAAAIPQAKQATPSRMADQGASAAPDSPLAPIIVLKEAAMLPKVIDQARPTDTAMTEVSGEKPSPISSGATTATGT